MAASDAWKVAETWFAKFLDRWEVAFIERLPTGLSKRHPSQGIAHEDLSGDWYVAEHKFRKLEQYSAEFRKAVAQHDINKAKYPDKQSLICFTFHFGRGKKNRRFIMLEITDEK